MLIKDLEEIKKIVDGENKVREAKNELIRRKKELMKMSVVKEFLTLDSVPNEFLPVNSSDMYLEAYNKLRNEYETGVYQFGYTSRTLKFDGFKGIMPHFKLEGFNVYFDYNSDPTFVYQKDRGIEKFEDTNIVIGSEHNIFVVIGEYLKLCIEVGEYKAAEIIKEQYGINKEKSLEGNTK